MEKSMAALLPEALMRIGPRAKMKMAKFWRLGGILIWCGRRFLVFLWLAFQVEFLLAEPVRLGGNINKSEKPGLIDILEAESSISF